MATFQDRIYTALSTRHGRRLLVTMYRYSRRFHPMGKYSRSFTNYYIKLNIGEWQIRCDHIVLYTSTKVRIVASLVNSALRCHM